MDKVQIPHKSWVVVCDGAKALAFRNDGDADLINLTAIEVFSQADLPSREAADKPQGQARSAASEKDPHNDAETAFLDNLMQHLDVAAREQSIKSVILVAPPKALGILRKQMSPALKALVQGEIGKDFAHMGIKEIEKHLAA